MLKTIDRLYTLCVRVLCALLMLVLLVSAIVVGIYWLRTTSIDLLATPQTPVPSISAQSIVRSLGQTDEQKSAPAKLDEYQRIAKALETFAEKHGASEEETQTEDFLAAIKNAAQTQSTEELQHAYVSGLAQLLETTLLDPKLDALIRPNVASNSEEPAEKEEDTRVEPLELVGEIYQKYNAEFNAQAEKITASEASVASEKDKEREAAYSRLIQWAGALVLSLLLLLALTLGRIEHHLRASKPSDRS